MLEVLGLEVCYRYSLLKFYASAQIALISKTMINKQIQ